MTFQDALTAMQAGHRVRRAEWNGVKYMYLDQGDFLGLFDHLDVSAGAEVEPVLRAIALRAGEILALDWELVDP